METPKEYYYTYYSYEEWGRGYFGSRGCKCLPEKDVKYFGSSRDKTFRPTQKIILKDDYLTREEAYADEIILQRHYKVVENPHFANKAYQTSTRFYISKEVSIKSGKKCFELGVGIHALTPEQRSENSRKNGKKNKELGTGIFARTVDQMIKDCRKGGNKAKELGIGVHGISPEKRIEIGKKSGKISAEKHKKNGTGFYGQTKEQKSEAGKIGGSNTSSQRWKCTETGFITTPGPLSIYQRTRGIDTSQRVRVQ